MRIGEINQDNYKQFMQMLGIKNSAALDRLFDKASGASAEKDEILSEEELYAKMLKMGYVDEEGMLIKSGDMSWKKTVHVSDEIKDKIIDTVRRQFLENGNGMSKEGAKDGMEIGALMKEYRKNIPVAERLSVTWTLSQIQLGEAQRLTDYVKSQDPTWKPGLPFDRSILTDSNFGTITKDGVDVKA